MFQPTLQNLFFFEIEVKSQIFKCHDYPLFTLRGFMLNSYTTSTLRIAKQISIYKLVRNMSKVPIDNGPFDIDQYYSEQVQIMNNARTTFFENISAKTHMVSPIESFEARVECVCYMNPQFSLEADDEDDDEDDEEDDEEEEDEDEAMDNETKEKKREEKKKKKREMEGFVKKYILISEGFFRVDDDDTKFVQADDRYDAEFDKIEQQDHDVWIQPIYVTVWAKEANKDDEAGIDAKL
jgi:hypothetical protein